MDEYDSGAECPKCGSEDVVMVERIPWVGESFKIRLCRNCGYEWKERPLDEETPDES